ncbi:hypothetical protein V7793_17990 [Streptomyces sp. KLMMK]|uniref:hypothetical protein n=1 Tax=Streptomyces sp. KLMMK TaxID=3109353 RepID=UPI00300B9C98
MLARNMMRGIIALASRCTPVGGSERPSAESTAVYWMTPDELAAAMTEAYAVRLLDALSSDTPYVRVHDGRRVISAP